MIYKWQLATKLQQQIYEIDHKYYENEERANGIAYYFVH
jgi:hypothetical protein